jgi:hypothetical protein
MAIRRKSFDKPRAPEECTPQSAARDARRIAEFYGLKSKPFDVVGLVYALGLKLDALPLEPEVSGFLKSNGGSWVLGVNSLHHSNRRRFTVAHELGHYFLHRNNGVFHDRALFRAENQIDVKEREANEFATNLLMPEADFLLESGRLGDDLNNIAKTFGVSEAAAKFRKSTMGAGRIYA